MKKILVALALWPSAAFAQVDNTAKCDALIQEAKVESALLKSPSAILRLGTVDTSEQNVIGGVSYSFTDRHRGSLIDQRALVQCEEARANDDLINYLRYVKVEEDQVRAASETAFLRDNLASERSAKLATDFAAKALDNDVGGVLYSVQDSIRNYADEAELVERNEIPLNAARAEEYGRILASIEGVDTGRARLIRAQAIARKIYSEAILSGLRARVSFMKTQSRALQPGS